MAQLVNAGKESNSKQFLCAVDASSEPKSDNRKTHQGTDGEEPGMPRGGNPRDENALVEKLPPPLDKGAFEEGRMENIEAIKSLVGATLLSCRRMRSAKEKIRACD